MNYRKRQELFESQDELSSNMMCVVGMGREAAVGQFRLGGFGQTSLRVKRTDKIKRFHEDPIYKDIKRSLEALGRHLRAPDAAGEEGKFINPFLNNVFYKRRFLRRLLGRFGVDSITLSHPLGGCRMAKDVEQGVVDEHGRVFDERKKDQEQKVYEGLYIADGSIIPTALGVNPSLTISALSLRIADNISKEL
jgi:choline dehydrogenase-like flavoprotein